MRELLFYSVVALVCLWAVKDPLKGLMCYTFVNIIRPELFFWGGNTGALAFKLLFLCTVVGFLSRPQRVLGPARCYELWCLLWLFLAVLVSLWLSRWAPHPRAYYHATEVLKLFVYAWIIVGLLEERETVKKFQNLYLAGFTLLALWGWDQHFRGNTRLEGLGGNAFPDSNGIAAIFVLALPLAFAKLRGARERRTRMLAGASMVAIAMAVVFTQSRGGFLGLAFCVLLGFFHSRNKLRFAGGALLLFMLLTPFIHDAYLERIGGMTREDFAEKDGSAGSRLVLWRAAILMFQDKPIFGHGFMTFSRAKMDYRSELDGTFSSELLDYAFQPYKVCHGTYFNLLAEGGLFLTTPYLLLIAGFLWKYYRNRARIANGVEDRESVYLLEGIAVGVLGHCVSILTIDSHMDIFMPIQLVCGGILLRSVLQELAEPQTVTVLKVQEEVA